MQVVFGILLIITGAASGLLFQDPVVCRFTESNQCYVALGQQLHLQMPLEDRLELKHTDKTFTDRIIIKYRKTQSNPPTPNIPGWQFVNDNKTLILTSAERRDSGTYNLSTFDANGTSKCAYPLQLNIEAQVFSVKVSYSCLSNGVMNVSCSADGDNLRFNWTSDLNTLSQLENRISTLILDNVHHRNVTCSVENHVSRDHITTEVYSCPAHDQDEGVEYAEVVTRASKKKQKKKEDEVQYVQLVFYTPARSKHKVAKLATDFAGWSPAETGVRVALSLEGQALRALEDLRAYERKDWAKLRELEELARHERECTHTNLVQHMIDTGNRRLFSYIRDASH
ncbi:uncharacterized protein LOC128544243 [Clarias gariepinus]|uniref:uncharacterized protein LOC128544243 n=1 Tax=Clarias gariepinus TaxID=13013 RepID=UPI00234D1530|nr:uncharacterized protein LOC128544243 [Clarias gariepinus]